MKTRLLPACQVEQYAAFATAFQRAFPDATTPAYDDVKSHALDTLLAAIVAVQTSNLARFQRDKAVLVLRAVRAFAKVKPRPLTWPRRTSA